ncbi:MAG: pyridoxamine 5'-phosphate oxidase family protein [Candidatus Omnitrophota bacterium]
MKQISPELISFLHLQSFVIVTSIDKGGFPHSSCKAIAKIDSVGLIYLIDVYRGLTGENIKRNPLAGISVVDEHKFIGYCFKGKARILPDDNISQEMIKKWEDNITSRLAKRLLVNLSADKTLRHHPEASLPKPQQLIVFEVEDVVDLAPRHLKKEVTHG